MYDKKNKKIKIHFGCRGDIFEGDVTLLKQVHGSFVHRVAGGVENFSREGDALITNLPSRAIGVLTADCLPVVFHDQKHCAVGIAHAGWRGSVQKISCKVVNAMQKSFGTKIKDLRIYFGPAAKACCYEVQGDFCKNITEYGAHVFSRREGKLFFDNSTFNSLQLKAIGVDPSQIIFDHHACTICNKKYCSYRRDQKSSERQMSVVSILPA